VAGVALPALGWLWWRAWFPVGTFTHNTTPLHTRPLHTLLSPTALLHGFFSGTAPPFHIHVLNTPILHHLFSLSCLSHPIFAFLLLLIGRS